MIQMVLTGKCKECPYFDLDYSVCYVEDIPIARSVSCKNQELCDYIEQHLRKGDKNNG